MKILSILVVTSDPPYGLIVILGMFAVMALLVCLIRRQGPQIQKAESKAIAAVTRVNILELEISQKFESYVNEFYQKLNDGESISPQEIKKFSTQIALCPESIFKNMESEKYRSMNEKIAKFLDGKYAKFFDRTFYPSKKKIEKIIQANAEQLEKIITQELYPV